jgi:hypothetical protein
MSKLGSRSGTVLIVVAGVIAALALLGVSFLFLMSSKSKQTKSYVRMEQARQAAASAIEFCCAKLQYVSENSAGYLDIEAQDLDAAVEEANKRLFEAANLRSLRNLNHKLSPVVCDAFNPRNQDGMPLGYLSNRGAQISEQVALSLDPVGAVYTSEFEFFESGDLEDDNTLVGAHYLGESDKTIKFFGWGRAFDRVGDTSYAPVCDHALKAELSIRLSGQVVIRDDGTRLYQFTLGVNGFTARTKLEQEEWPWDDNEGLPWFLDSSS